MAMVLSLRRIFAAVFGARIASTFYQC